MMAEELFTPEQERYLRSINENHFSREVAEMMNSKYGLDIKPRQIANWRKNHKLPCKLSGCFQKGHVPANKGMRGVSYPGMEKTQFKKGNIPHTHKPVGTESIRNNYKRGQRYIYIKIAEPNVWVPKHTYVWEQHHGPVPDGHAVVFADGDTLNCEIDNLILVSRATLVRMNQDGLISKDPEITKTGAAIAELKTVIGKRIREANE